ncbi:hypothetical protein [Anaerosolibacter sp.]|uniref:hypothetical protein n=1 Tax=Anaerosolibacter sp. TaxID=1872527 RepID=UPI0039F12FF9
MPKVYRMFAFLLLSICISTSIPNTSYANSAEPPSILIIVPNAPDDLEISIGSEDTFTKAKKTDKTIERYYTFYYRDVQKVSSYTLSIMRGNTHYEIALDKPPNYHNNIYTLDLGTQTLTQGKSLSRSILLISLRIILTLVIEGIVFWQFGFRKERSWKAFVIINLITQGWLNLWINSFSPLVSYLLFSLIFAEMIIIIVETLLFSIFTKEHSKATTIAYVLCSNILSLVVGGYIITKMPV